jgi:hypothetical protein
VTQAILDERATERTAILLGDAALFASTQGQHAFALPREQPSDLTILTSQTG